MQILVTGSKGQLGSEFHALAKDDPEIRFTFTDIDELDLTDFPAVHSFIKNNDFDYCVNCAGYTAVDQAEDEQERAFLLNADAVENLAKECTENNVKLIHVSTDYVFDGKATRPYKEDDPVAPQSVYGASKLQGELAVLENSNDAIIIRTAWLCSQFGKNFVKTILKLANEKSELGVVDDQIGSPTFAEDMAKAILHIIKADKRHMGNEIYHYSNGGVISWYIFAKEIVEMAGLPCEVKPVKTSAYPTKAKRPAYSVLDTKKIKREFNMVIPDWKTSLLKLINQLKETESND